MNLDGKPFADDRRLTLGQLLFFGLIVTLITIGIAYPLIYFLEFSPPHFQVDSLSISVDDNNVAKWNISFSVKNPNLPTLHHRKIEVAVGGRRAQSSTTARITPMFEQRSEDRSSRNATVYVALSSPRPALIVDGSEFDIRFLSEYESTTGKKGTMVAVCGDNYVKLWPSNGEVAIVGGPMLCH